MTDEKKKANTAEVQSADGEYMLEAVPESAVVLPAVSLWYGLVLDMRLRD